MCDCRSALCLSQHCCAFERGAAMSVESKRTGEMLRSACNHQASLVRCQGTSCTIADDCTNYMQTNPRVLSLPEWQLTQEAMQQRQEAMPSTCSTMCGQCHVLMILQAASVISSGHCAAQCQDHRQHLLRRPAKAECVSCDVCAAFACMYRSAFNVGRSNK